MFPVVQVGPLAIQTPGLFLLAGLWFATSLVEKDAARRGLSVDRVSGMILWSILAGVIGARLWYAVRFLDVYLQNPLSLLSLNPATLAVMEGMLTGLLVAFIYGQRKQLPLWLTLDALSTGLAMMALALAFSHLASGDAFGAPTSVPWGIELWGAKRHPSQVYAILLNGGVLLFMLRLHRSDLNPGAPFLVWVMLMALGRLFLEAFRGDSQIWLDSIRSAQILSLMLLILAGWGLHLRSRSGEQLAHTDTHDRPAE